ncbi:hypothetical protein PROFUN_12365 [Planoprotostelium fungivorum]|uniref:Uncharacterized protein n=1 Tax=Planoprotostelium fungivorum TaxID=1890364 RepID=A0A2P6N7E2_9EUKA|nr:hypothetical protein PROFUN_12365 [Planoprotostelium fungivorum]
MALKEYTESHEDSKLRRGNVEEDNGRTAKRSRTDDTSVPELPNEIWTEIILFCTSLDQYLKKNKKSLRSDLALILGVLKRYRSAEESDDPYTMHLWSQIDPIVPPPPVNVLSSGFVLISIWATILFTLQQKKISVYEMDLSTENKNNDGVTSWFTETKKQGHLKQLSYDCSGKILDDITKQRAYKTEITGLRNLEHIMSFERLREASKKDNSIDPILKIVWNARSTRYIEEMYSEMEAYKVEEDLWSLSQEDIGGLEFPDYFIQLSKLGADIQRIVENTQAKKDLFHILARVHR